MLVPSLLFLDVIVLSIFPVGGCESSWEKSFVWWVFGAQYFLYVDHVFGVIFQVPAHGFFNCC